MKKFPLASFRVLASAAGATATILAGVGMLNIVSAGTAHAAAAPASDALTLINGWTSAPYGTNIASVKTAGNTVEFRGAIATTGTNAEPFVLPKAFRPATTVYVPVDMCGGTNGRLAISPDGTTTVQAQTNFSNAQCFTSLDGVSFARTTAGYTNLSLINGWTGGVYNTSTPAVALLTGVVHLKGAIATSGTNAEPFVLPVGFRPSAAVFVKVDMCNGANGRLAIATTGDVYVEPENNFSDAQCFTSLDGVSFALTAYKPLKLVNGWTGAPFGTREPAAKLTAGVVRFKGGMSTLGTNAEPFVLPAPLRPAANVFIPVDMCNATNGRLNIGTNGAVTVTAETNFANASCFTSLDGVSFVK